MRFVFGNLSFAFLFLIPILAFIFMLFFRKDKKVFVEHLIHSLHIHSFSLFLYGIGFIVYYFTTLKAVLLIIFLITVIYWFFFIRQVYKRGVWSSLLRLSLSGIVYYLIWAFTLPFGLIISLLLF